MKTSIQITRQILVSMFATFIGLLCLHTSAHALFTVDVNDNATHLQAFTNQGWKAKANGFAASVECQKSTDPRAGHFSRTFNGSKWHEVDAAQVPDDMFVRDGDALLTNNSEAWNEQGGTIITIWGGD